MGCNGGYGAWWPCCPGGAPCNPLECDGCANTTCTTFAIQIPTFTCNGFTFGGTFNFAQVAQFGCSAGACCWAASLPANSSSPTQWATLSFNTQNPVGSPWTLTIANANQTFVYQSAIPWSCIWTANVFQLVSGPSCAPTYIVGSTANRICSACPLATVGDEFQVVLNGFKINNVGIDGTYICTLPAPNTQATNICQWSSPYMPQGGVSVSIVVEPGILDIYFFLIGSGNQGGLAFSYINNPWFTSQVFNCLGSNTYSYQGTGFPPPPGITSHQLSLTATHV